MGKKWFSNKDFCERLCEWRKTYWKTQKIDPSLIVSLKEIISRFATKGNFRNYSYLEDMKNMALVYCIRALFVFNPDKTDNAHAYFTKTAENEFIKMIKDEKQKVTFKFDLMAEKLNNSLKSDFRENKHQSAGDCNGVFNTSVSAEDLYKSLEDVDLKRSKY